MRRLLQRLRTECKGAMAIETAIVAPVLVIMALGVFEVGTIIARQHELQTTANEAAMIVLAANRGPEVELSEMKAIIKTSVDLPDSQIAVSREYRCNMANGRIKEQGGCPTGAVVSSYIVVSVNDSYTPTWTAFGIGNAVQFAVNRTVQVS